MFKRKTQVVGFSYFYLAGDRRITKTPKAAHLHEIIRFSIANPAGGGAQFQRGRGTLAQSDVTKRHAARS
jgi:hypothetical protein